MTKALKIFVLLITGCLLLCSASMVCFAQGAEFYFEDTVAKQGRLFDITLYAKNGSDIAAFEAEITYDANSVAYRDYTLCGDGMQAQVNSSLNGLLKVVFLCEDGVDCSSDVPLISFSFKALSEGSSDVSADISGLINSEYESLSCTMASGSVMIDAPPAGGNSDDDENSADTTEQTEAASAEAENKTTTEGKVSTTDTDPADGSVLVIVIVVVLVFLGITGFVVYKIIAIRKSQNSEDSDNDVKKELSSEQKTLLFADYEDDEDAIVDSEEELCDDSTDDLQEDSDEEESDEYSEENTDDSMIEKLDEFLSFNPDNESEEIEYEE